MKATEVLHVGLGRLAQDDGPIKNLSSRPQPDVGSMSDVRALVSHSDLQDPSVKSTN